MDFQEFLWNNNWVTNVDKWLDKFNEQAVLHTVLLKSSKQNFKSGLIKNTNQKGFWAQLQLQVPKEKNSHSWKIFQENHKNFLSSIVTSESVAINFWDIFVSWASSPAET